LDNIACDHLVTRDIPSRHLPVLDSAYPVKVGGKRSTQALESQAFDSDTFGRRLTNVTVEVVVAVDKFIDRRREDEGTRRHLGVQGSGLFH
jgi:hypothetical protein